VDPTQAVRRELVVLPQPALGPLQLRRLQSLGLAWPDDATLGLLGALPTRLPTPPGPRPRSWWRQVYCLVGMAARLHPHEPRHGAALAAVHCGVLALIAAHAQAALGLAQERARHDAAALDACLAAQGLDLAGLILDLAVHWRRCARWCRSAPGFCTSSACRRRSRLVSRIRAPPRWPACDSGQKAWSERSPP